MGLLTEIFTWWNGQTLGTRLFTSRNGKRVGEDETGNVFYQTGDGKRRWVIFKGTSEASRVSPDWHGWLHHTYDAPPTEVPLPRKPWEQAHKPNLTGTPGAYHPPGSLHAVRPTPAPAADYEPWRPE